MTVGDVLLYDTDNEELKKMYIFEKKYYLIFIIFNMLITTFEHFNVRLNLEIPTKYTFKSNPSLKNYKNYINISEILIY